MPDRIVERDTGQTSGATQPIGTGAGIAALAVERAAILRALDPVHHMGVDEAADAQRRLGAGDQKRSREAAHRDRRRRRPSLRPESRHIWTRWARGRRLRELVDPFLEELLISLQI